MAALNIMNNNDIELYVQQLINPATRENALLELSKKRENFPDLAPYLWYSFGTIAALLQEIVSIYPLLSPPALTAHGSNRVCNALALLQCVASHPETRGLFLQGELVSVSQADTCWLGPDLIDVREFPFLTLSLDAQHMFLCSCTHSSTQ